jgi:hypothetical protein
MGYGVLSHQFGLASQFAHQLSIRTGRGAEWSTIPLPDNVLRNAPRLVTQVRNNIARADYVILLVGIADTVSLTSSTAWGRQLGRTLDAVLDELSADALLLLPQIPPLNKAAAIPLLGRWASTHQARLLNRVSSQSVLIRSQCISVDFPPGLDNDIGKAEASPATYRAMYAAWAAVMVDAVLPPEAAGDQSSG